MRTFKNLLSAGALVSLLVCVGCPAEDGGTPATDGAADAAPATDGGDAPATDGGDEAPADDKGGDEASGIDASHVKAGQKYTYTMQNNMEMVWEVVSVSDTEVKYTTAVIMGGKPTGEPTEQTMALVTPAATGDTTATTPAPEFTEETITVGDMTFECKVYDNAGSKSWTSMKFPCMVKSETGGKVSMELTKIE